MNNDKSLIRLTAPRKIDLREETAANGVVVPESLELPDNEPVFLPYQHAGFWMKARSVSPRSHAAPV